MDSKSLFYLLPGEKPWDGMPSSIASSKHIHFPEGIVCPKSTMASTFCRLSKWLDHSLTTTVHSSSLLVIQKYQLSGFFCLILGIFSLMGNHM